MTLPPKPRLLVGGLALLVAMVALLLVGTDLLAITVAPRYISGATPAILVTSDLIRRASPWVLGIGLAATASTYAMARTGGRAGATARLAIEGLSGTTSWSRRWLSASVLTVAMVGAVNASLSAVEQALTEGPSSSVTDAVIEALGLSETHQITVLAQHENLSFMDTSHLTNTTAEQVLAQCRDQGGSFVPFALDLPYVDSPRGGYNGLRITTVAPTGGPFLVASPTIAGRGDKLSVNGTTFAVTTAGPADLDFINRTTLVQGTSHLDRPFWGIFVTEPTAGLAECAHQTAALAVIPLHQLTANNRTFWERNGTPVILVLTLALMLITALLAIKDRVAQLEHQQEPLTALRLATNQHTRPLHILVACSALVDVYRALVILLPASLVINAMFNAATFGLRTGTGTGLAVAYTLAIFPSIIGATVALRRQLRQPISTILRSGAQ